MRTLKRRKKERKTDYLNRLKLLKGGKPRIVFRKTNKHVLSQYVESESAQDRIVFGINSKSLLNYGWPKNLGGSLKSIPAAYLVGYLSGKKILKEKLDTPIVDLGMYRVIRKTKIFAFIKGLIDSGIKISCSEKNFPEKERILGKSTKKDISKSVTEIKSKMDEIK